MLRACRRPAWSSPRSSSRAGPRPSQRRVRRSRSWIYQLLARYQAEGDAASSPSGARRPTRPRSRHDRRADRPSQAADRARAWTPAPTPSPGTWPTNTSHRLAGHHRPRPDPPGLVDPSRRSAPSRPTSGSRPPCPTRPGSPTSPTTDSPTRHRPGTDTEIVTWLDDYSRYALHVTAHARITGPIVLATFRETAAPARDPASTLTDNGLVYTTRFAGGRAAATASNPNSNASTSSRRTPAPTTPPPAARSSASNRP